MGTRQHPCEGVNCVCVCVRGVLEIRVVFNLREHGEKKRARESKSECERARESAEALFTFTLARWRVMHYKKPVMSFAAGQTRS